LPVAGVVLDTGQQQGDPSGQDQDLAVLFEGDPLALELRDPAQPGPALGEQLVGGHERVFRTQAVRHHAQAVHRSVIEVGALQPADQLQCVHPGDR
jgi:hypothetical protein